MNAPDDRFFKLLPPIIRDSDAFAGYPLQALLRVMAEQAQHVEYDIAGLLDNFFVETCDSWVLPYLGELLGQKPVADLPAPPPDDSPRGLARAQAAYPRRAFARLVHARRRKGVLLQLQELARDLADWPARAVELRPNIAAAWSARFPLRGGARTVDFRDRELLDREGGPFAALSRRSDSRALASAVSPGRGNVASVALYVWRLKVNTIQAGLAVHHEPPPAQPARTLHSHNDYRIDRYVLNPFGLDTPLFTKAKPLPNPTHPASELEVPGAIRLEAMATHPSDYYGPDKSVYLWRTPEMERHTRRPFEPPPPPPEAAEPPEVHDLADWENSPTVSHLVRAEGSCWVGMVIDPTRGRVLRRRHKTEHDTALWVRCHTAFSADIGGGGYFRETLPPPKSNVEVWPVGGEGPEGPHGTASGNPIPTLALALDAWDELGKANLLQVRRVIIEIRDDATHFLGHRGRPFETSLRAGEYLEIRAATHRRPVIRHAGGDDSDWAVSGELGAAFILDGLALVDVPLLLGSLGEVRLRHCTLAAGRELDGPLELDDFAGYLAIENSVVYGTIHVRTAQSAEECDPNTHQLAAPAVPKDVKLAPARVIASDSILDGSRHDHRVALAGWRAEGTKPPRIDAGVSMHPPAHISFTIQRGTVLGHVNVHALPLAEESIFTGTLRVSDTANGCVRFCALAEANARTPPRHACQEGPGEGPRFTTTRFGDPAFTQLAADCPRKVSRGAADEAEMGAFHDLYQAYRESLLRAALAEFVPADADAQLLFVN